VRNLCFQVPAVALGGGKSGVPSGLGLVALTRLSTDMVEGGIPDYVLHYHRVAFVTS
jgi:hypothetical protein